MKLLFDQNLSPRLVIKLEEHYPASSHVVTHALDHASDETVWAFARKHDYTLVTKDSDFHELSLLYGAPPKVVWIRRGNCTNLQIEEILRKHASDIQTLIESSETDFLILY
jgi:predicted nuclease of predicted toxin-antitoxin system